MEVSLRLGFLYSGRDDIFALRVNIRDLVCRQARCVSPCNFFILPLQIENVKCNGEIFLASDDEVCSESAISPERLTRDEDEIMTGCVWRSEKRLLVRGVGLASDTTSGKHRGRYETKMLTLLRF